MTPITIVIEWLVCDKFYNNQILRIVVKIPLITRFKFEIFEIFKIKIKFESRITITPFVVRNPSPI